MTLKNKEITVITTERIESTGNSLEGRLYDKEGREANRHLFKN